MHTDSITAPLHCPSLQRQSQLAHHQQLLLLAPALGHVLSSHALQESEIILLVISINASSHTKKSNIIFVCI
jgi:hypothetical protein